MEMFLCAAAVHVNQCNSIKGRIRFGLVLLNYGQHLGPMLWPSECVYKIVIIKHRTDDQLGLKFTKPNTFTIHND